MSLIRNELYKGEVGADVRSVKRRCVSIASELGGLHADYDNWAKPAIASLQADNTTNKSDIAQLQRDTTDDHNTFEDFMNAQFSDNTSFRTDIVGLKADNTTNKSNITSLQTNLSTLQSSRSLDLLQAWNLYRTIGTTTSWSNDVDQISTTSTRDTVAGDIILKAGGLARGVDAPGSEVQSMHNVLIPGIYSFTFTAALTAANASKTVELLQIPGARSRNGVNGSGMLATKSGGDFNWTNRQIASVAASANADASGNISMSGIITCARSWAGPDLFKLRVVNNVYTGTITGTFSVSLQQPLLFTHQLGVMQIKLYTLPSNLATNPSLVDAFSGSVTAKIGEGTTTQSGFSWYTTGVIPAGTPRPVATAPFSFSATDRYVNTFTTMSGWVKFPRPATYTLQWICDDAAVGYVGDTSTLVLPTYQAQAITSFTLAASADLWQPLSIMMFNGPEANGFVLRYKFSTDPDSSYTAFSGNNIAIRSYA